MSSTIRITLFTLSLTHIALCELFQSEVVVPVIIKDKRCEERITFRLSAFGRQFTLNLTPDDSFLAPLVKIHRIKSRCRSEVPLSCESPGERAASDILRYINATEETGSSLRGCFYSGTVDSNHNSMVAVSLCHGIHGSFIAKGDEYLIEPQRSGTWRSEVPGFTQPHVVRRRLVSTEEQGDTQSDRADDGPPGSHSGTRWSAGETRPPRMTRKRRFVSTERYIETLVVADASMARFYGDDIKHYLLTLVGMAAQLYKHPSLKNSVNVVVVKMLVVEDEEVGPGVSSNGDLTLRNFCAWQQLFNPPSQRHPEHYDTALLFTREDICRHQSCNPLGVADVGTMCDSKRSCSVIEDNGLQAAFTVAHELGHVLSMPHDDSKNCQKKFSHLGQHHMMAPVFVHLNRNMPWSPCSAYHITEFFDSGHGDCLLDKPEKTLPLPTKLPGLTYSLDRQCQQAFGEAFRHCPNVTDVDVCGQLWCQEEGQLHCTTRNSSLPWADGTPCGFDRTCLHSTCMAAHKVSQPQAAVDGSWGAWGHWGPCSRTCGGGVEFSHRECTNPEPQHGGRYCVGQRVKYQSCNTQACSGNNGKSFREEQCEMYNSIIQLDAHGKVKQWIPKYSGVSPRDRCKLFCRARGSSEFRVFESKVIDGTTCGPDTTSICVQGQCVKAGCDLMIGSNEKLDKCGVCGGDGSSCRKVTGSMSKAIYGYNDIVTIPAGATNIDVKQRSHRGFEHDGNYLAVMGEDGEYILNGNFSVSTVEQDIPVQGAVLRYSGSSTSLERIQSFRQLGEAITIQLLATAGDALPPRVKYTFYLPKDISLSRVSEKRASPHAIQPFTTSEWTLGEWSECSKSCGSGWSRRDVECRGEDGALSFFCDEDLRPADIRPCGDLPCPIWQMGPWSSCSRTCGRSERQRSVFCIDYTGKTVQPERCDPTKKPALISTECVYQEC
ncbi:A disintegrin and metalloproteinase with thrombospondin motifs 8-like [Scleropages formosus]|uniref:A disintegrin and metalloproteinase with thrombospondin motifs 8-like n=1 Tax=Scleropages formosus TaxID=113540 RepID=A0A0P7U7D7_SCLFO|nr:A disintegrin and metalloproteinase with thrombospondin motifs 8-like [Scleropages formosus]